MQAVSAMCLVFVCVAAPNPVPWQGTGSMRILVRVDRSECQVDRPGDKRPADVVLDFPRLLARMRHGARLPDLRTLQVIRQDPVTGAPIEQGKFAYGHSAFDIPWRWYDASIGYEFPEFRGNVDATHGSVIAVQRRSPHSKGIP